MVQWEEQALFDAGPATPPPLKVGEDAARTARRRSLLAAGLHPTSGRKLREGNEVCGSCAHCVGFRRHTRTYWKCAKVTMTRGPATDVRLSWPACVLWEKEAGPENPAAGWPGEVVERPTRLIRDPACASPNPPGHFGCDCRVATYEVEVPVKTLPPKTALIDGDD